MLRHVRSLFDHSLTNISVFTPIYLTIILPESQKLARPFDRKTAVISFTKTLANSEAFANKYKKGWGFTCEALLKLLALPPLPTTGDDVIAEHDVEDMAFGVGFTPLSTVKMAQRDPFPEVAGSFGAWVGTYLKEANKKHNGRITSFVQERLSPETQGMLSTYLS